MADTKWILNQLFLLYAYLFVIAEGARYSSSRYSSSRYSSRSYSSRSYRSSYSYSSSRSGISWRTGLLTSQYYGSRRYMTRSRYYSDTEPRICENYENLNENGTGTWGMFVCPLGELPDDYDYCCGETDKQTCCRFFDDPGRTAGVVIGVLLFFALVGLVIFFCYRCHKKNKLRNKSSRPISKTMRNNRVSNVAPRPPAYPMAPGYPPAGMTTGYPPTGMTPGYPPTGMTPGYPPAGMTRGYPPAGMTPVYTTNADHTMMPPSYQEASGMPHDSSNQNSAAV